MFRHSYYLEIPWTLHWHTEAGQAHHHLWWLIAALAFVAIFLIGVGVTSGIVSLGA